MYIKNNIKRLLKYRQSLINFEDLGFERIYSHIIAKDLGVSPEQVRKDFSEFGIKGNKKGGYQIKTLLKNFNELFGEKACRKAIIVGMGNLGNALCNYRGFGKKHIKLEAGFDIDPTKLKNKSAFPVYNMNKLPLFIKERKIKTGIIAVPEISATEVCKILIDNGITGILNFSPLHLKVPNDVIINNISLSDELESIFYYTCKMGL